jgi:hypothetical protein
VTIRVYLAAAMFREGPAEPRDLAAERVFVNASDVKEVWVETESDNVPEIGKSASFALVNPLEIGFRRITGTVERKLDKARRG